MIRCIPVSAFLLSIVLPLSAQDVVSGPAKGEKIPALKVYDATGDNKDKDVDYVAERKEKPTIYIVVQADKFSRPMNRFMKILDDNIAKDFEDVYVVAVWLTGDTDQTKQFLPKVQQSVKYQKTALTCFTGDVKEGPKDWGINGDAHCTVVVTNKAKVEDVFGYNTINDTDVRKVLESLKKAKGSK